MWEKAYWIWRRAGSIKSFLYFIVPYWLFIETLSQLGFSQRTQDLATLPLAILVAIWALFPMVAIWAGLISALAECDRQMHEAEARRKWEAGRQKMLFDIKPEKRRFIAFFKL